MVQIIAKILEFTYHLVNGLHQWIFLYFCFTMIYIEVWYDQENKNHRMRVKKSSYVKSCAKVVLILHAIGIIIDTITCYFTDINALRHSRDLYMVFTLVPLRLCTYH